MKRRQLNDEIWHGDCRAGLPRLASNTIDLTITSPPWDGIFDDEARNTESHIMWELFTAVAQELSQFRPPTTGESR